MKRETYDAAMSAPDPRDRVAIGCNDCDAYLTVRQCDARKALWLDWQDLGDDGALCPKCAREGTDE